jgi:hypothetical protein
MTCVSVSETEGLERMQKCMQHWREKRPAVGSRR